MRPGNVIRVIVVAALCAGLYGCGERAGDAGGDKTGAGVDKMTIAELRASLKSAIDTNHALAERLTWYDPNFTASMEKARAARRIGDKEGSKVAVNTKTNVKVLDLDLLSPVEEDSPSGTSTGEGGIKTDTSVSVLNTRILSPGANEQVRALQAAVQALSNRIVQQDQEIARLTTKLAKHGINPAPE